MTYRKPTRRGEYEQNFAEGYRISGEGLAGIQQHIPCPFCAAPDWKVFHILAMKEAMESESECRECGRAATLAFALQPGAPMFDIQQTRGDVPDAWVSLQRMAPGYDPNAGR